MIKSFLTHCLSVAVIGAVALAGCKRANTETANGSGTSQGGTIKIGHYGSLTGEQATFGISTDNGVKLAVKEINAKGGVKGKQIQLITYDDRGVGTEASTAVTRLIDQDGVSAVIGEVASSLSLVGGPICQNAGVPMVSPSSTNPAVTEIGDMVFRACFIDPFQGYVGASFAKNQMKVEQGAILFDRTQAYSVGLAEEFKKAFVGMGGKITLEAAYATSDSDFNAQISQIKASNPQFVYIPGYYTQVVNIARQARQAGLSVPLLGGDGWVSDELKNAGDALNGCYFSDHYSQEDDRPEVKTFLEKYRAEFGQTPDSMAALGYDTANMIFAAIERSSTGGKELAAALASTKDFAGVTGKITMDAKRNARKLAVIQRIDNGVFKFHAKVDPPTE